MRFLVLFIFLTLTIKVNSQCAALNVNIGGPSTSICNGELLPITSNVSWPGPGT